MGQGYVGVHLIDESYFRVRRDAWTLLHRILVQDPAPGDAVVAVERAKGRGAMIRVDCIVAVVDVTPEEEEEQEAQRQRERWQ